MVDPLLDIKLEELDLKVFRPEISDSDEEVLELAEENICPILTRDKDFVKKHRKGEKHHGIIFDSGMHHRANNEIMEALRTVIQTFEPEDIENTVLRLKRFY